MTLEEISESLPNGFHDAEVRRIVLDYSNRALTMESDIWVGSMDDPPETREAYRSASVKLSGLLFCAIDLPKSQACGEDGAVSVDDFPTLREPAIALPKELVSSLPASAFLHTFYVNDWSSFIHVAAECAEMEWLGPVDYRK
jgi:hypothetical protein